MLPGYVLMAPSFQESKTLNYKDQDNWNFIIEATTVLYNSPSRHQHRRVTWNIQAIIYFTFTDVLRFRVRVDQFKGFETVLLRSCIQWYLLWLIGFSISASLFYKKRLLIRDVAFETSVCSPANCKNNIWNCNLLDLRCLVNAWHKT